MIKTLKQTVVLVLVLFASVVGKAQDFNSIAVGALANRDFLTLREVCENHADKMEPLVLAFAKPVADVVSHRHEEAEKGFNDVFANHADELGLDLLMMEAYFASRNYEAMQKYGAAASLCQQIVDIVESMDEVPNSAADGFRVSAQRYGELAKYPAMTLDAKADGWTVPMAVDTIARGACIVVGSTINGQPACALFDTGAGHNMIRASYAKQLGLKMIDTSVTVLGGGASDGIMAIADEMTIGDMKLHNVLFVVSDLSSGNAEADEAVSGLNVIIGRSCMQLMQEFTMDFEKMEITVPAVPAVYDSPNIVFSPANFLHYVCCIHDDEPLMMNIDTGSTREWGHLDVSYYEAHKAEVDAVTEYEEDRSFGIGGYTAVSKPVLRDFKLSVGGKEIVIPKILVSKQAVEDSAIDASALGLEFFSHQKKVTISYKCSRMIVE